MNFRDEVMLKLKIWETALVLDVELDNEGLRVYWHILRAEEAAVDKAPKITAAKYKDNAIGARLLGFLLQDFRQHQQHSFGLIPYKNLVNAISSCLHIEGVVIGGEEEARAQHKAIYTPGLFYRNHLLRVFWSDGDPVPTVSQHPSRTSMERIIEEMETPSIKSDIRKHTDYAANATAILKMFGLSDAGEHLVGGNVSKHFNVFTMVDNLHHLYNHLEFWLEEFMTYAHQPNTYDVCAADPTFFTGETTSPPRRRVTFKVDPDVEAACRAKNKPIPALPSPSLLAIRAACSRVGSP
ncbi:hypothetical protein B0H13DRAFT_2671286 [Mycena leptocephala]|nr:hypothetical protein B0H13DRAFT_2671286 [Mycena leptocephala]